jgi:hypothetical protein
LTRPTWSPPWRGAHYHRWRLVHSADELTAEIVAKRFVALGAAGFVDHASELDERAVAGALNDTPVMHGDSWVDQIAALARSRASVGSSSAPASRLYPTISATRIAAIFRVSLMAHPSGHRATLAQKACQRRQSHWLYVESERAKGGRRAYTRGAGFGVGSTRSLGRRAMTAICAFATFQTTFSNRREIRVPSAVMPLRGVA